MALMKALKAVGTVLREPIFKFNIVAHELFLGKIISELNTRRAKLDNPVFNDSMFRLSGSIPAATLRDLNIKLNSLTSGKLRLNLVFEGYTKCPEGMGKSRAYKGVNPLDEAKWILHRRGAYKADERNI